MIDRKVHINREKGGAFYHGERVAQTALYLRKIILPDDTAKDDILTVASWFHDIGKGLEPHNKYGAVIATEALIDLCSEKELHEIVDLIEHHCTRCPQCNDYSDYVKLLQDADILDHYGTFTIWMDFLHSAHEGKTVEQTFSYNLDEWDSHCLKVKNLLNYEISKTIFDEKVAFINEFYARFRIEGTGGVYNYSSIS